jgi:hypothetical protein
MAQRLADKVKAAFLENLNLKLLSFAFALVLYSLVHGNQDAQRTVSVNLVLLLPPESANRILVNQIPPQVRVTLRGTRPILDDLRADDLSNIQVDVHSGTQKRVSLDPSLVHAPAGVRVEHIDPPLLELQWEDRIQRELPIQVSISGTPATGFVVQGGLQFEPTSVKVTGPQSDVATLQQVRADPFEVQGLTDGKYTRQLALERPHGRVFMDVFTVQVTANVSREVIERMFPKIPVHVMGPARSKVTPAEVDVKVICPPEDVRTLRPEGILVKAEVAAKEPRGVAEVAVVAIAEHCKTQVSPGRVTVRWPW